MDVDQFARVLVAIERSGELPRVLAQERLSEDDWAAERGRWRAELADDPEQRVAFRRAFQDARAGRIAIPTSQETATASTTSTDVAATVTSAASNEDHSAEPPFAIPRLHLDETAMVPSPLHVKPALPFAGETTPERLAEIAGPAPDTERAAKEPKQGFDPDETAMLPSPLAVSSAPSTGSFRDQLGAVVVPILSLEEYAHLRAELALHGEEDPATLKRFNITSSLAHAALKARFAQYFTREPDASTRFVSALQARIGALRSSEVSDVPIESPNPDGTAEIDLTRLPDLLRARGIPFPESPAQEASTTATIEPSRLLPRIDTGTEEIDLRMLGLSPSLLEAKTTDGTSGSSSASGNERSSLRTELIQQIDFSAFEASVARAPPASGPAGQASTSVGSGNVSLERFAEIQAALTKSRDRNGVLRHYGFTDLTWAPVSREMGAALTADSTLHTRYEQLYREAMHHVR